ncbi:peptidoglycan recognition protein family protein [Kitasatospora sp. NPDC004289]
MDLVRRSNWGAAEPKRPLTPLTDRPKGVKIHYEGTAVPADLAGPDQHHRCAARVRAIQASHMANTAEGYVDGAYTAIVCPHSAVYEMRGAGMQCAANGNGALNKAHYAVCAMLGDSGLTEPTEAMLNGLVDAIEWLRRDGGAGPEVRGHRDGYATSCPGEPLYRWVQQGAPRPAGQTPPPVVQPPQPPAPPQQPNVLKAYPGHVMGYAPNRRDPDVQAFQQRMRDRGWGGIGSADGYFGQKTLDTVRAFQAEKGLDRDGLIGPATWTAAFRTDNIT